MKTLVPRASKGQPPGSPAMSIPPSFSRGRTGPVSGTPVYFTPAARTAWHSHAVGQSLHIIECAAVVQGRGGEVATLAPGDTVYTASGVEHWHGAMAYSFMVHHIWEEPGDDSDESTWGGHVTDEECSSQR